MKTTNTLRILAGLSLLIFFCPFFQMCSDENIPKKIVHLSPLPPDSIAKDSLKIKAWEERIAGIQKDSIAAKKQVYLDEHRSEFTHNAYEVGYVYGDIISQGNNEIGRDDLYDPFLYFIIFFILSIITALLIFILSLLKKLKTVFIICSINAALILTYSLLLFIPEDPIEHLYQIKFGYYLFIVNSIALIFVSHKAKKSLLKK